MIDPVGRNARLGLASVGTGYAVPVEANLRPDDHQAWVTIGSTPPITLTPEGALGLAVLLRAAAGEARRIDQDRQRYFAKLRKP